jgi:putative hydrolase of the HAD superfamily
MVIRGLVIDLDDTLCYERDYVRSGFTHVGRAAGRSDEEARTFTDWLWTAFKAGVRGDTFDRLLEAFPNLATRWTVHDLVQAYREHEPNIELIPGWAETIDALRGQGLRLAVLTDGPVASQSAKARALGLHQWFDPIVLTGALGATYAKPASAGFNLVADAWGTGGSTLGYVADNPEKDFVGPRRLGWMTIRLRQPQQLRYALEPANPSFRPDIEVGTPLELLNRLKFTDGVAARTGP